MVDFFGCFCFSLFTYVVIGGLKLRDLSEENLRDKISLPFSFGVCACSVK